MQGEQQQPELTQAQQQAAISAQALLELTPEELTQRTNSLLKTAAVLEELNALAYLTGPEQANTLANATGIDHLIFRNHFLRPTAIMLHLLQPLHPAALQALAQSNLLNRIRFSIPTLIEILANEETPAATKIKLLSLLGERALELLAGQEEAFVAIISTFTNEEVQSACGKTMAQLLEHIQIFKLIDELDTRARATAQCMQQLNVVRNSSDDQTSVLQNPELRASYAALIATNQLKHYNPALLFDYIAQIPGAQARIDFILASDLFTHTAYRELDRLLACFDNLGGDAKTTKQRLLTAMPKAENAYLAVDESHAELFDELPRLRYYHLAKHCRAKDVILQLPGDEAIAFFQSLGKQEQLEALDSVYPPFHLHLDKLDMLDEEVQEKIITSAHFLRLLPHSHHMALVRTQTFKRAFASLYATQHTGLTSSRHPNIIFLLSPRAMMHVLSTEVQRDIHAEGDDRFYAGAHFILGGETSQLNTIKNWMARTPRPLKPVMFMLLHKLSNTESEGLAELAQPQDIFGSGLNPWVLERMQVAQDSYRRGHFNGLGQYSNKNKQHEIVQTSIVDIFASPRFGRTDETLQRIHAQLSGLIAAGNNPVRYLLDQMRWITTYSNDIQEKLSKALSIALYQMSAEQLVDLLEASHPSFAPDANVTLLDTARKVTHVAEGNHGEPAAVPTVAVPASVGAPAQDAATTEAVQTAATTADSVQTREGATVRVTGASGTYPAPPTSTDLSGVVATVDQIAPPDAGL